MIKLADVRRIVRSCLQSPDDRPLSVVSHGIHHEMLLSSDWGPKVIDLLRNYQMRTLGRSEDVGVMDKAVLQLKEAAI
jgi:hypothetical protein